MEGNIRRVVEDVRFIGLSEYPSYRVVWNVYPHSAEFDVYEMTGWELGEGPAVPLFESIDETFEPDFKKALRYMSGEIRWDGGTTCQSGQEVPISWESQAGLQMHIELLKYIYTAAKRLMDRVTTPSAEADGFPRNARRTRPRYPGEAQPEPLYL